MRFGYNPFLRKRCYLKSNRITIKEHENKFKTPGYGKVFTISISEFTKEKAMNSVEDIFDIFRKDENFQIIMKRLLEATIEESFNGIMITEASKGYPIVYVNAAFCNISGYGPHELIGESPSILQGSKTDPWVIENLSKDISEGKLFHGKTVNYRKDGSEFMMEWKIIPIKNEKKEITHFLAIQRDVS
jgi:PAS domain S-box-containing protein